MICLVCVIASSVASVVIKALTCSRAVTAALSSACETLQLGWCMRVVLLYGGLMLQKAAQAEVERCSTPLMAIMIGLPCPSSSLSHSGTPQMLQGAKTKRRRGWKVSVLSCFCSWSQRSGGMYRRMFSDDGSVVVVLDFPGLSR